MIPIIINNYNRLETTRNLVNSLLHLGYRDIHILDNNSTYPPLLSWYRLIEDYSYIKVKHLGSNVGPLAVYSGYLDQFIKEHKFVAYTDSDIELNINTPANFLEQMVEVADKHQANKVGLALEINDLPDNEYAQYYKNWEKRYWVDELEPNIYKAEVDTTFCIIKPNRPFGYDALRMAGNFTARHIPWYTDFAKLSEEEQYYLETSSRDSTYKRYYNNYILKETDGKL